MGLGHHGHSQHCMFLATVCCGRQVSQMPPFTHPLITINKGTHKSHTFRLSRTLPTPPLIPPPPPFPFYPFSH